MNSRWLNITQHWALMVPLLLIVAGLAIRQVDRFPISVDELLSMNNAGYINHDTSIPSILSNLESNSAQHVPAYFLLLGVMSNIFGWVPPALRMIGVWFGLLALAGVYRIGREQHSGAAGLYAAMFMAGLTLYSFYYAHIRMYTMLTATTAFFVSSYLRLIQASRMVRFYQWLNLSISTFIFLSTHIFSITLIVMIGLYHLLFVPKNRRWFQVAGAIMVGGTPLLLWLPVLLKGFQHTSTFSIVTLNALSPPEILFNLLIVYSNNFIPLLNVWGGVAFYVSYRRQQQLRLWLGWSIATAALIIVIGGITPILPPDRMRYSFVILIPLSIVFGTALAQFRYHVLIAGVIFGIWFGTDLYMHRTFDMSSYLGGRMNIYDMPRIDEHAPKIASVTDDATLILSFSNHHDLTLTVRHGNTILDFYYEGINRQHYSIFLPQEELKSDSEIQQSLSSAVGGWSKLVLIIEDRHQPSQRIQDLYADVLSEMYLPCDTVNITSRLNLTYYQLIDSDCE